MSPALDITIALEPVPASRPRVSRWGTHYAGKYKQWLADAPAALAGLEMPQLAGPVFVMLDYVFTKAKSSKLDYPRADVDNIEKSVFDSLTKAGAWLDDNQVVQCLHGKRFAEPGEAGHVRVQVWAL